MCVLLLKAAGVINRPMVRRREERDPPVDSGVGGVRRADIAGRSQPGNIVPRPRGQNKGNRGQNAQSEPSVAHDQVKQHPSGAPVAVHERMDGLELRMGDGRLRQRRKRVIVAEGEQVVQKAGLSLVAAA